MAKDIFINDRVWRKLLRRVSKTGKSFVKIGVLQAKGGTERHEDSTFTIVELATVHEFGSRDGRIPERSFIRRTFAERSDELKELSAKLTRGVLLGEVSDAEALEILGLWGAAAVKKRIVENPIPPPLKPQTIARKGSSRPLVDTGQLINSISHEVVK